MNLAFCYNPNKKLHGISITCNTTWILCANQSAGFLNRDLDNEKYCRKVLIHSPSQEIVRDGKVDKLNTLAANKARS